MQRCCFYSTSRFWVYEHRSGLGVPWTIQYVFKDTGFSLSQVETMNKIPPEPWTDKGILCVCVYGGSRVNSIVGNDLTWRQGPSCITRRLESPRDVLQMLEQVFNIKQDGLVWW